MGFRFVGAHITNYYWIGYIFSLERHCRFWDDMNGVGAVDLVPNVFGQLSNFISQRLGPGCFIGARNDMVKLMKIAGGGMNDRIGLKTVAESGCIGVSGADESWLMMAAVAERVTGRVGRDDMWKTG